LQIRLNKGKPKPYSRQQPCLVRNLERFSICRDHIGVLSFLFCRIVRFSVRRFLKVRCSAKQENDLVLKNMIPRKRDPQNTTPAGGGDPAGVVLGWLETWEEEYLQPSSGSAWEEDGFTEVQELHIQFLIS
jgi:hypothetical protein